MTSRLRRAVSRSGSLTRRLGSWLGGVGTSAWSAAKHYAGKGKFLRGKGSNNLVDRAGSFLNRKASTALKGSCCFVAGTVVWTASGQLPIEHVQVGHLVLSKHHETGEVGWYPVIDTIEIPASALLVLTLEHESGEIETVETTDEHPFRVAGVWARADTLVPGTTIETMHGTARVTALAYGSQRQTVYNITVRDAYTYLVGDDKVWVHNCGIGRMKGSQLGRV
ncbi:MAG: polymorphic toxin-type HINT domain-containing protein [Planctomycetota bacterium]